MSACYTRAKATKGSGQCSPVPPLCYTPLKKHNIGSTHASNKTASLRKTFVNYTINVYTHFLMFEFLGPHREVTDLSVGARESGRAGPQTPNSALGPTF